MMRGKRLREMLDQTDDRIIKTYNRHGGLNHIKATTLPAQGEIIETLESLVSIIFPGFFDTSNLNATNIRYHLGAKCAAVYQQLADQIDKCFRYFCKNESRCRRDSMVCTKNEKSCLRKAREISRALLK